MSFAQLLPIILMGVGIVLGGAGLLVCIRAGVGDRSRGRRRCPRCWYDMAGVPGLVCPECGRAAGSEQKLRRTRRRWRRLGAGVVMVVAGVGTYFTPAVRQNGWLSVVPTAVLVHFAPSIETEEAFLAKSTGMRMHPVAAELAKRLQGEGFTAGEWRTILTRAGAVYVRQRWPIGEEPVAVVREPRWLGVGALGLTGGLEPVGGECPTLPERRTASSDGTYDAFERVAPSSLAPGARTTRVRVNAPSGPAQTGALIECVMRVDVSAPGRTPLGARGVWSPEIDAAVRAALVLELVPLSFDGDGPAYALALRLDREKLSAARSLRVAVAVMCTPDDLDVRWHAYPAIQLEAASPLFHHPRELTREALTDPGEASRWVVRIRGVCPLGYSGETWTGEVVVPLSEIPVRGGAAP